MKKDSFFKKKRFHLFKSLLYKNGKAEKRSVVASRLVYYGLDCNAKAQLTLFVHLDPQNVKVEKIGAKTKSAVKSSGFVMKSKFYENFLSANFI